MQLNGFKDIWKSLNNIDIKEELNQLNELAYFPTDTEQRLRRFQQHWERHHLSLNPDGSVRFDMTPDEYNEMAHILSSYDAVPIGKGKIYEVHGYETQDGARAKYVNAGPDYAFVAYDPNTTLSNQHDQDVWGQSRTYFHRSLSDILLSANPYHLLEQNEDDHRYKCDIGGGLEGLKYLTPDKVTPSRRVSSEQAEEITKALRAKQPLPVYRVGENNEN